HIACSIDAGTSLCRAQAVEQRVFQQPAKSDSLLASGGCRFFGRICRLAKPSRRESRKDGGAVDLARLMHWFRQAP
ncbi:MAG: hypothetical protein O7G83_11315, partial [Proteobacteria bacterium]|nr:hypothetical protein [Pseudomonadota bacterium]